MGCSKLKVAVIGNHAPRRCGLATFTGDVAAAIAEAGSHVRVVAMNDRREGYGYPDPVCFEIYQDDPAAYRRAAEYLNLRRFDVVNLQHEFGIFGGNAGENVVGLMRELNCPIVTTLHTILREPDSIQREVFENVLELSDRVVTMSETGKHIINQLYGYEIDRIDQIPHGVPDVEFQPTGPNKEKLGLSGKQLLLTFGLVSPNKGIEHVIRAMPEIVAEFPEALYLVVGQTHPHIVEQYGESYRQHLENLVAELGLGENVRFHNAFVPFNDLVKYLLAADVYITPYLKLEQITSGTLSYAVGCGKANVSTPLWHAEELLADGRGVIVPPASPDAVSAEVIDLLKNPERHDTMARRAYEYGRSMTWPVVAEQLHRSFDSAIQHSSPRIARVAPAPPATLNGTLERPHLSFGHLKLMSDDTGLFQHAKYSVPNRFHGYCTDDNARGLLLAATLGASKVRESGLDRETGTYMSFLHHAFDETTGRFRNFMSFDRRWLEDCGSEDSNGRAIWALGKVADSDLDVGMRSLAVAILAQAIPITLRFTYPRSWAFAMLGLDHYSRALAGDRQAFRIRQSLAERLLDRHETNARPDWNWFEPVVTYDNARIPQALLLAGIALDDGAMKEVAISTLTWLCEAQKAPVGVFAPVGNSGFWDQGSRCPRYDQQPLEAWATVSAAGTAYEATGCPYWQQEAQRAYRWFLGGNSVGQPLVDLETGGCRDGLGFDGVNENMGAESTLAHAMAAIELMTMESPAVQPKLALQHEQSILLS